MGRRLEQEVMSKTKVRMVSGQDIFGLGKKRQSFYHEDDLSSADQEIQIDF